jgi:hypothetical protein
MDRSTKIYLLSLLLFGGGIFWVIDYGNSFYISTQFISKTVSVGSFWENLRTTFLTQLSHPLALLLVQIIVIMAAARTFGVLISKFSQPPVIGEIFAGVLLGPSLLGLIFPRIFSPFVSSKLLSKLAFFKSDWFASVYVCRGNGA